MRIIRPFLAAAVLAFAACPAARAQPISVALVTDVEGNVRLVRGRESVKAGIPADIFGDTRLEIDNGARVVILMLASGEEATVRGPASAAMAPSGLVSNPANALSRKVSGVGSVKLRKRDLSQAAIVMRNNQQTVRFPLLSLAGTISLETRPRFRWSAVEGVGPYQFSLMDGSGHVLFATRTGANEIELPATLVLEEGRPYMWEVRARRANGLEFSNFGDFSLATAALRAQASALLPAAGASFAERVAYAIWLDSADLVDASRKAWRSLADERPGEQRLRQLAGP